MNRLQFLKTIFTAPALAVGWTTGFLPLDFTDKRSDITLLETHVAGTHYYQADGVLSILKRGDILQLRREPSNKYDDLAIEVLIVNGAKLGYVPRQVNEAIASLMDNGSTIVPIVAEVEAESWPDIRMKLVLKGNERQNAV